MTEIRIQYQESIGVPLAASNTDWEHYQLGALPMCQPEGVALGVWGAPSFKVRGKGYSRLIDKGIKLLNM
ncbi:MAG: hypothetical protein Q4F13_01815 [Pseudomonadota bacterium]|nr:hypothetical protein [Pseudomonadota bacterium]